MKMVLNTADIKNIELIEKHMLGFFFGEGDHGQQPAGFNAGGGGGKKELVIVIIPIFPYGIRLLLGGCSVRLEK